LSSGGCRLRRSQEHIFEPSVARLGQPHLHRSLAAVSPFQANAAISPQGRLAGKPRWRVDVNVKGDRANPAKARQVLETTDWLFAAGQADQLAAELVLLFEQQLIYLPHQVQVVVQHLAVGQPLPQALSLVRIEYIGNWSEHAVPPELGH